MPIPKPNIDKWGYEELLPQFSSRQDYYDKVKPRRIKYLQHILTRHSPRVVIGYGKAFWPSYKKLFPEMEFSQQGEFEVGKHNKTLVVMTGHFTARSMNGRFEEVVNLIKQENVMA